MNIQNPHTIATRIEAVRREIQQYEAAAGRAAGSVQLLAVSKTRGVEDIQQAIAAGCTQFGESYVQEATEKILTLDDETLVWHFIGPIQSNKTRVIAAHFAWVHSVDRLKIAQRLDQQRAEHLPPLQVCIQVNISGESSKSGLAADQVASLLQQCQSLPRLRVRGLMTVPRKSDSALQQQQCFAQLRQLQLQLNQQGAQLDTLSMGMSSDLKIAIEAGSNMVRVGSAIFGARHRS